MKKIITIALLLSIMGCAMFGHGSGRKLPKPEVDGGGTASQITLSWIIIASLCTMFLSIPTWFVVRRMREPLIMVASGLIGWVGATLLKSYETEIMIVCVVIGVGYLGFVVFRQVKAMRVVVAATEELKSVNSESELQIWKNRVKTKMQNHGVLGIVEHERARQVKKPIL